jgi:hypothetical protein
MTKLILEIPTRKTLDALLPLLRHLKIRFTQVDEVPSFAQPSAEVAAAIRAVQQGCDMSSFGDAAAYQADARQDRNLPFRNG